MQITDVRIRRVTAEGIVRAMASITLDSVFVVHELKVLEGPDGLFVAMPNRYVGGGRFEDVAHPLNTETRKMIQKRVIEEYHKVANHPTGDKESF